MINKNKLMGKIVSAGYTQKSLAQEIGISKNTINSKINGNKPFNITEIDRICNKIGIISGEEKANIFLYVPSHNRDAKKHDVR